MAHLHNSDVADGPPTPDGYQEFVCTVCGRRTIKDLRRRAEPLIRPVHAKLYPLTELQVFFDGPLDPEVPSDK